ncbi:MAG: shikimate kinase AroK [Gammaproteobacteria bacterium]|nr:shikimate kinase AroK [Gammaproteobacteria bacterium]MXY55763.1 shikimate kinase AroK [Gammaproteobacteria bacterium]MYF28062.1 shikimate kinase AroK [Gammaproteobacteria bacterium]MYK47242.1 shikimate kinase AroK [Gammaproteobacteria bacterium]
MTPPNVYLVGMMAVGKTTVGRHLASRLGFIFHDTDQVIESRAGADISWIFELEGEERFRDREQQVIEELTLSEGVVLATGGGAVLRDENRALLRDRGIVVYLHSDVELIVERTRRDRRRPLLQVQDVRERIETLTAERGPLYESVAHLTITVDRRPPKAIAVDIHHLLKGMHGAGGIETVASVHRCAL